MSKKRIVVIGGGTGSHTVLTGLKGMNCDLTAVVAMTDDGGSSGRLRQAFGQLPPGDVRQCLMALADDETSEVLKRLFDYRFTAGEGLDGHSLGNLLLSALTEITGGADAAIREASKLLGIQGTVLPVTLTRSTLKARLEGGSVIEGESYIDRRAVDAHLRIESVYLDPSAMGYPPALEAIGEADAIVIGPGDIYTSILPNLLVKGVPEAVVTSSAIKIHVCNLMTKRGESDGFAASDFLRLLGNYLGVEKPVDFLIGNSEPFPEQVRMRYEQSGQQPVVIDEGVCLSFADEIVEAPMIAKSDYARHNPPALAEAIMGILESAGGEREAAAPSCSKGELSACVIS